RLANGNGKNGHKNGNGQHKNPSAAPTNGERLAAVQGYQWHMLNASENWITKGVRAEFAGSYVLERAGQELFGTMKMISGSVYMIRADILRRLGWSTSITEDWELTIRLYLAGYKVLYTPYIQAPAECVSTVKRFIRLSWLLVPFQAYASIKGLLEREEGGWVRTPKSGLVTEALGAFKLAKLLPWELPKRKRSATKRRSRVAQIALTCFATAIAVVILGVGALSVRAAGASGTLGDVQLAIPTLLG